MPTARRTLSEPSKPGTKPCDDLARLRIGHHHLKRKRDDDHADQSRDRGLEAPEAAGLQREDPERRDTGENGRRKERDAEQQVEPDRSARELRDVGGHGDHLRLDPEQEARSSREPLPAELRQVAPGRDAELRAHRLDEHRHQVRHEHDPEQEVAELRPGSHVRGEVARVDIRDRRDERWAEERDVAPHPSPAPAERLLRSLEDARLAGQDVVQRVDEGVAVAQSRWGHVMQLDMAKLYIRN